MSTQDEKYMQTALKLAGRGIGLVEPNPAVGAVIVKANQVIGKGWHKKFGGPHAEINALEDCKNLGVNPSGATMYVTLEPCSHEGKTGPCTQAIIEAGLAKVVAATIDPAEHAGGRGIRQLRDAGIEVQLGLCEAQAKLLNAPFIKFAATGRCWVTLKWAQSIDGKLAPAQSADEQGWISNELSRKDAHKLRRRAQAILVGINTVLADDPLLTARPSQGKKATRIVLDSFLRIPPDCKLLETAKKCPVLIYAGINAIRTDPQIVEEISKKGAEVLACPPTEDRSNLHFLLDELSKRGIAQLLVEGGPAVLASFLKENLADEIVVYIAPKILGGSGSAEITGPMTESTQAVGLNHVDIERFGDNVRLTGLTRKAIRELSIGEG
jgi:diaminohydroxyphosphoribosylaminopyrimidine deaminase/5-amino-6-(5-phosphoribosylamino)uracil reductase